MTRSHKKTPHTKQLADKKAKRSAKWSRTDSTVSSDSAPIGTSKKQKRTLNGSDKWHNAIERHNTTELDSDEENEAKEEDTEEDTEEMKMSKANAKLGEHSTYTVPVFIDEY